MEEKIEKILNDEGIKYSYKLLKASDEKLKFDSFYIDINISDDENAPQYTELIIWIPHNEKTGFINYYIPKVMSIPKGKLRKVKSFLLDYNVNINLGAFGVRKKTREISFTFGELATYSRNEQNIFEIRKIPTYIRTIQLISRILVSDIKKLCTDEKESDV